MRTFSIRDQVEHKLFGRETVLEIESVGDSIKSPSSSEKIRNKIISTYVKLIKS